MDDVILSLSDVPDFISMLERTGATWQREILHEDGEIRLHVYDIFTVDDLMSIDIERLTDADLTALLPKVTELYENIEGSEPDEDDFSEDEYENALENWEDRCASVEESLVAICKRLNIPYPGND